MTKRPQEESGQDALYWSIGLGSAFGAALAILLKEPIYFAIGLIFGIAIGAGFDQNKKRKK